MNIWMVRAGVGGQYADKFAEGYVAIRWREFGDMTACTEKEEIRKLHDEVYPDTKVAAIPTSVSMFHRFRSVFAVGDKVVTYDVANREYLVGSIVGDYEYKPELIEEYPHTRKVEWQGRVSRDLISTTARNTLGSTLTLFSVPREVWDEFMTVLKDSNDEAKVDEPPLDVEDTMESIRRDTIERSHEFIKDKILTLDPGEMEELVAAVLRAMGYKTRVSPKGPDRGVDVFASPDGLGLEAPRIKAEVKHRKGTQIGSPEIRSFIGGLREGDRGIYVSTGGFTREGRYEADRSIVPVTLVDLDELANLVVMYYESFDLNGRALVPLVRVYWVAE